MAIAIGDFYGQAGTIRAFRAPCAMHFPTDAGSVRAAAGDWVVLEGDGKQSLYAPEAFAERFSPVSVDAGVLAYSGSAQALLKSA
jgi:hypothetical protein